MPSDPVAPDQPNIRLPLAPSLKWAVRVWLALLLFSPCLVFFRFSVLPFLILAAVLGGFLLPFLLGRMPGELEAGSERVILLNPRAQRYAWLYLLGKDNPVTNPVPKSFSVPETCLLWEAQRLSLNSGGQDVVLGHGTEMEPVRDWLMRHGVQAGR